MKTTREITSVIEFVPGTIREILNELTAQHNLSEDDIYKLRLIMEEALTNAVQHGNQFNTGLVAKISLELNDDTVTITVTDQGEGFDYKSVPDPTGKEELKSSGRGIFLMKKMADEITYSDSGRELTILKKVSTHK